MLNAIIALAMLTAHNGLNPQPVKAAPTAPNGNLIIGAGGRVFIELLYSDAFWSNTMSVKSPAVKVASSGCMPLEEVVGLLPVHVVSEKKAKRGCRVELDADPNTPAVELLELAQSSSLAFAPKPTIPPHANTSGQATGRKIPAIASSTTS
ncbi:MAG: hypothetical protein HC853_04990 [Anaerolineae bacterium]|nr:hypothetical protein [Anaerolineae bacterium]